jgi:hypothetical protein
MLVLEFLSIKAPLMVITLICKYDYSSSTSTGNAYSHYHTQPYFNTLFTIILAEDASTILKREFPRISADKLPPHGKGEIGTKTSAH